MNLKASKCFFNSRQKSRWLGFRVQLWSQFNYMMVFVNRHNSQLSRCHSQWEKPEPKVTQQTGNEHMTSMTSLMPHSASLGKAVLPLSYCTVIISLTLLCPGLFECRDGILSFPCLFIQNISIESVGSDLFTNPNGIKWQILLAIKTYGIGCFLFLHCYTFLTQWNWLKIWSIGPFVDYKVE